MKVYVASSWRCQRQLTVVQALQHRGVDLYDFRNPPNGAGFGWEEVMPFNVERQATYVDDYLRGLDHPRAVEGFDSDFSAMEECDTCVLVLPCGRSAHLELGWFVGQGKRTAILLDGPFVTPELMYKMVDYLTPSLATLIRWIEAERWVA